jgi:nucleotide-binding universal stress UspA family protein
VSVAALRRVVVPLDGSAAAERALPLATELANTLECAIHLVTVDERDGGLRDSAGLDDAEAYLERQADKVKLAGLAASTEWLAGAPAAALLDLTAPGDLLVLTTHGRGAARRWQIGSVAEKLLRQATAPVVLVRADST